MAMSRSALFIRTKATTGSTPNSLIGAFRMGKAASMLLNGRFSISEVAFATGSKDASYFSKQFKAVFGINPKAYKTGKYHPDISPK